VPARTFLLIFAGLLALMLALYGLVFLPEATYSKLIAEERLVEGIGALALLAAAVLFFLTYRRLGETPTAGGRARVKRLALLLLAVAFLFGFGEEISWGQRLVGIDVPPEIKDASSQEELNLHNIEFMQAGWLDMDHAFQVFWLVFGVMIPVAAALYRPARRLLGGFLPLMPLVVAAALTTNQVFHYVAKPTFEPRYQNSDFPLAHSLYETKETMVAVIFAVGAFYLYRRAKDRPEGSAQAAPEGDLWQDVILAPPPVPQAEHGRGLSRV
jgi:hypothetical protein